MKKLSFLKSYADYPKYIKHMYDTFRCRPTMYYRLLLFRTWLVSICTTKLAKYVILCDSLGHSFAWLCNIPWHALTFCRFTSLSVLFLTDVEWKDFTHLHGFELRQAMNWALARTLQARLAGYTQPDLKLHTSIDASVYHMERIFL